jgi:hypothetical protein
MYDLVWAQPMTSVAEDFGISDVALKKICDKHRVPTPPRGYWAKKEAGKPVKAVKLFDTADPQDEHIVIHGAQNSLPPEVRTVLDEERERRRAKPKVQVSIEPATITAVADPHPAIAVTARTLRKVKPDQDSVVRANGAGCCGVEIGVQSVERVIALLDAIARALEVRSLRLIPAGKSMQISVAPATVTFALVEQIEKRKHVPTMDEFAKEERLRKKREQDAQRGLWSFDRERTYPEFDYVRSGALAIQIENRYVDGLRRSWKDGQRQRLETLVDAIAGGIATYLAGVKARREQLERQQQEWRRREERARLARARNERETRRIEFLQRFVDFSTEADKLRSFMVRLNERMPASPDGELVRMRHWVEARLDYLEGELTPRGISGSLRERNLFPEIDDLVAPEEVGKPD